MDLGCWNHLYGNNDTRSGYTDIHQSHHYQRNEARRLYVLALIATWHVFANMCGTDVAIVALVRYPLWEYSKGMLNCSTSWISRMGSHLYSSIVYRTDAGYVEHSSGWHVISPRTIIHRTNPLLVAVQRFPDDLSPFHGSRQVLRLHPAQEDL